tara:strand:+ start:162 stop:500 length:339 start_codon:yes stop_codon:yes gene_type:complete
MGKQKAQPTKKPHKKATIPKAIREQVWLQSFGKLYEHKCKIRWCKNIISVFDYHVGHDQPESKGGTLDIDNLKPICARCNTSMSDNYTIKEWDKLTPEKKRNFVGCCGLFPN